MLACAWLALAANAYAAPTWLPPEDIAGPTQSITFPEISVNSAGDAVVIWPRDVGSDNVIEVLERPAGGEWSEPEVISDPGEEEPADVHIGLDAAGNAVAVWRASDGAYVIRTAVRTAGGDWSAPEDLFTNGGQSPHFAMNDAGDAVAVWYGHNGENFVTWAAVRPAGGDWSAPEDLSVTGEEDWFGPEVAIDADGNAIAVWERLVTGDDDVIRASVRPDGGDWSAPDDLSVDGEEAGSPSLAMNEAGDAVAAWTVSGGIRAATRPSPGDWSAPEEVSAIGVEPTLAIDSNGNSFALWPTVVEPGKQVLQVAMRPPSGEWSASDDLSAEALTFQSYDLDTSAAAGTVATWTRGVSINNHEVQAAVHPPGGDWSAPEDLSLDGEDAGIPKLDFDAAGNAIVVWGRKEASAEYFLRGAGYDFSGPQLNGLQSPPREQWVSRFPSRSRPSTSSH